MKVNRFPKFVLGCAVLFVAGVLNATDWPMWRANAGRTASVAPALPEQLAVLWSRELPPLKPAFRDVRLQFDKGYEPVVLGQRLFVASSRDDSVMALATDTGAVLWKVFADGPVRFAPVAGDGKVIFGSDDGVLRCVSAATGQLLWQKRAVPNNRQLLGNGRLVSVWPIRGGPVLHEGRVYFAAGVWPLEGVFIYCLDAATGRELWLNDRLSYLYGVHPHQAEAFGGVAPQGYLLVDGADLVVPCSSAYPARLDLATGKLKDFALPAAGRLPGGWFAALPEDKEKARLKRLGLLFDNSVNAVRHEDKPRAEGDAGVRRTLRAGGKELSFDGPWPGVTGKVHSVLAADGKVFVVTEEGRLTALGAGRADLRSASLIQSEARGLAHQGPTTVRAKQFLAAAGTQRGYALVLGFGESGFLEALAAQSQLKFLALTDDPAKLAATRQRLAAAGLYGERVALRAVAPKDSGLPPYFANFIALASDASLPDPTALKQIYGWLRPYGGRLVGPESLARIAEVARLPQASVRVADGLAIVTREGALEGSTNYKGGFETSPDELVKAPFGVLWFDDTLGHFKRSPQPKFVDGVMISTDKTWLDASTRKGKLDYRLQPSVFSDVYTGRVLDAAEVPASSRSLAHTPADLEKVQQSQYRPATQKDDWKPGAPVAGTRVNPLTGDYEPRAFPKSYGCDGGFDYGHLYTMRSGTAAFYDKRLDSGTIHISGPRSGCTSSVIPANGVLNVPYFYEGCSCSYPLPMALSLVSLPPTFEQWAAWGSVPASNLAGKIERIGLNFGAPGDRRTDDGTLWLAYPAVGGPSPKVDARTEPAAPEYFYRHSVWIEGGEGWPWVGASGVKGLQRVTVAGLKPGNYTVRLTFTEPDATTKLGGRKFAVRLQGQSVAESLDVLAEAGGAMRVVIKQISKVIVADSTLTVQLDAQAGATLLNGLEIIRAGLALDPLPNPARVPGRM